MSSLNSILGDWKYLSFLEYFSNLLSVGISLFKYYLFIMNEGLGLICELQRLHLTYGTLVRSQPCSNQIDSLDESFSCFFLFYVPIHHKILKIRSVF